MKKIVLLLTLLVCTISYATTGYNISMGFISKLGNCTVLEKNKHRLPGTPYVAAKSECENGTVTVFGPNLTIDITIRNHENNGAFKSISIFKSSYFQGKFISSFISVFTCDEYGIMEDYKIDITDFEVAAIYKIIRNFGNKITNTHNEENSDRIAEIMAKYN